MLKQTLFIMMLLPLFAATVDAQQNAENSFLSGKGHFRVSYESHLEPIAINRIHSWTLHVTTADGAPVSNATLTISGGMPEHNHGLATEPGIESMGEGNYLLQGLRFHMMGYWELELTIDDGSVNDKVVISLEL